MSIAISSPIVPSTGIASTASPQLNPEQVHELLAARDRSVKLRRAGSMARFDAWGIAIFAGITFLTGFLSPPGILLSIGMGYAAWREFRAAAQLRKLDPASLGTLAFNQICLGSMLILYALWQMHVNLSAAGSLAGATGNDPQIASMLGPVDHLVKLATLAVYGGIILIAIFVQGGTAWYYHSRERHLRDYLQQTPAWIIELQRAGVSI